LLSFLNNTQIRIPSKGKSWEFLATESTTCQAGAIDMVLNGIDDYSLTRVL